MWFFVAGIVACATFIGINMFISARDRRYEQYLLDDEQDWLTGHK
jgi:hypothetical protein